MYKMWIALTLIAMTFGFSGCACKPVVETKYVVQPKYEFQKVMDETRYKMAVDAGSKSVQRMCTPLVIEATDMVWSIVEFHEGQIDRYDEYMEKVDGNDTRGQK
jgi:hypothetical protein